MQLVAQSLIQSNAVEMAVFAYTGNPLVPFKEHIQMARQKTQEDWKPILDRLDQSDPDSLLDILRKFSGPVQ